MNTQEQTNNEVPAKWQDDQMKIANEHLAKQPRIAHRQKQVSPRRLFTLLGISLVIFAVIAYFYKSWNPAPVNDASDPVVVPETQLVVDYANNEISADNQYKNHYLKVVGAVQSISKDLFGDPYIVLAVNPDAIASGVQCRFDQGQENELTSLESGESVTVEGVGNGYVLGAVVMKDCTVLQVGAGK